MYSRDEWVKASFERKDKKADDNASCVYRKQIEKHKGRDILTSMHNTPLITYNRTAGRQGGKQGNEQASTQAGMASRPISRKESWRAGACVYIYVRKTGQAGRAGRYIGKCGRQTLGAVLACVWGRGERGKGGVGKGQKEGEGGGRKMRRDRRGEMGKGGEEMGG